MPKVAAATAVLPSLPQASTTIRVTLPNRIVEALELDALALHRSLDDVLATRLTPILAFAPTERLLLVDGASRRALEDRLGPLATPQALVAAVDRVTHFTLEGVALTLEPWQLEEVGRAAEREGISVQQALEARVKLVRELAFQGMPR